MDRGSVQFGLRSYGLNLDTLVTDPARYLVMVMMTLIALLDKKSPLSEYMSGNDNSFGKPWTAKHGMLNFVSKTLLLNDFMM
jgi:hypothetical protein